MKLKFQAFFVAITIVASFEATAINDHREILKYFEKTKKFLCGRGICLQKIPTIYLEEKEGYRGFVDHNNTRISISPHSDAIETQLNFVHELVHTYRKQFNLDEEEWLEEGLAKLIEHQYSTVWPVSYMERLRQRPMINLDSFAEDGKSKNYAPKGEGYLASFFLMQYLYTHFGQEELLQKLLTSNKSGWDNVINAIHELTQSGPIAIPTNLISKENILRHFAVSLWMNDMFAAKYALFYLDQKYEPLSKLNILKFPRIIGPSKGAVKIQFSKEFQNSTAQNVYSIINYDPFVIKEADPQDKALIFIYLFY